MRFGAYTSRSIYPAGQTVVIPPGAVGTDANGYYVDAAHNVLDLGGTIVGPPGSTPPVAAGSMDPINTAIGGGPLPPIPSGGGSAPAGPGKSAVAGGSPATTTSIPSGLPTGTIRQSGGSVSGTFIVVVVAAVVAMGGLAYYFTRKSEIEEAPTHRLRSARTRSYGR